MTLTGDRYQLCSFCVMDTSDPEIEFDEAGRCNHCRGFAALDGTTWLRGEPGKKRLEFMIEEVKRNGFKKEFDCIIGLSGGIDSSYLAVMARDWGLRPLVVHVDAGWNSELAVQNIQSVVRYTGFELHTHVVNWESVRRLQLAYLRSGIANQDVPQDHAFFAGLYRFATQNRINYVLSGFNIATEGILPTSWHGPAMDARNLKAINRIYGTGVLDGYPTISMMQYFVIFPFIHRMKPINPLNSMDYSKDAALQLLTERVGWRPYPRKHGESIFTKFFQNYYLPVRFGYDKRRPHLSSQIAAGSLTRTRALELLEEALYEPHELERDLNYVCLKLGVSREEFDEFMHAPRRDYSDFPNWSRGYSLLKRGKSILERVSGRSHAIYAR